MQKLLSCQYVAWETETLRVSRSTEILWIFRTPVFKHHQTALEPSHGSTRALRSSKPTRPYICRLIAFKRLMCPSMGPLLQAL